MAVSQSPARRFTYADLSAFPEDRLRREIIDGELVVTASPVLRHQRASSLIHFRLMEYARTAGGLALAAPMDVLLSENNVVQPDLFFVSAGRLAGIGEAYVQVVPDLLVEISSPSTRRLELVRKRDLYQSFGVPEYWFVDLEADRVEIYSLDEGHYPAPHIRYPGELLESVHLRGLSLPVDEMLALAP